MTEGVTSSHEGLSVWGREGKGGEGEEGEGQRRVSEGGEGVGEFGPF